ncbi:MAG: hypothetical protein HZC55_17820 [Verrucomicrobia bacterium]|nr:hypothetical protein [Verrucomicrobiota bacterium]
MNLVQKLENSWELMKTSLRVIRDHPRLALFPIVTTLSVLVIAAFFIVPLVLLAIGQASALAWLESHGWQVPAGADRFREAFGWLYYSCGAVIYLLSLLLGTFCNVAFYHEILRALAGQPVSVRSGFSFARSRIGSILMWSLLAGTVGLIIRAIEERLGWLGKIVMGLIGTAWSVAAVFAIPVIVRHEERNPFAVLRASALTLKQTWGESLVGFLGVQALGLVVLFASLAFALTEVILIVALHRVWLGVALAVLFVLALVLYGFVLSLATHVYRCALYVFASEGVVPQPYSREMMDAGWKIRKA